MDFSTLPSELQFEYLLGLDAQDVLSYCKTSTSAQQICRDPYFWDQKALRDFDLPYSSICNLEPYWRYQLMGSLQGYPSMIGPLLRTGHREQAKRIVKSSEIKDTIFDAISMNDPLVLDFIKPYIQKRLNWIKDRIPEWIVDALSMNSILWLKYLTSLNPDFLQSPNVLNSLLDDFTDLGSERAIRLLGPYIEALKRQIPDIAQRIDRDELSFLYDYLANH